MEPRRSLVTGGEGFLGANLARRLSDDGCDVHIFSRPNPARQWKLVDLLGVVAKVHAVDLLDRDDVQAAVAALRPEIVFHLAGRVDLERSSEMARLCIAENITTTVNLLDALQGAPVESVIYTSTTEVYGSGRTPFREDDPVDPPSPYSVSKVAAESFCRLWAQMFESPARILRMASAYGPGQPIRRLVPSVILSVLRNEPVRLMSTEHRRDFLYVTDAVDGMVRAATAKLSPGEILNLGVAEAITVREIAAEVLALMGRPNWPVVTGESRPNESPSWMTDIEKARTLLGWSPRVPIREGLSRTIAWYRSLYERGEIQ